jgi:hypothetical protein
MQKTIAKKVRAELLHIHKTRFPFTLERIRFQGNPQKRCFGDRIFHFAMYFSLGRLDEFYLAKLASLLPFSVQRSRRQQDPFLAAQQSGAYCIRLKPFFIAYCNSPVSSILLTRVFNIAHPGF